MVDHIRKHCVLYGQTIGLGEGLPNTPNPMREIASLRRLTIVLLTKPTASPNRIHAMTDMCPRCEALICPSLALRSCQHDGNSKASRF